MSNPNASTSPNTLRTLGAFDSYVQDSQEQKAREEYAAFVADCKRDLDPIEQEYGGIISFDEWCVWQEGESHA